MTITAEAAMNIERARMDAERREAEGVRIKALYDNPETIQLGEGATLRTGLGGLYVPYTVIAVRRNGRELDVQRDETINLTKGGWADDGEKEYRPNPNGRIDTITKRKDGSYIVKGTAKEWYSTRYDIGYRRDWTDYTK